MSRFLRILFQYTVLGVFTLTAFNASSDDTDTTAEEDELLYDELMKEGRGAYDPEIYYAGEVLVTGRREANIEQASTSTVIDEQDLEAHDYKTLDQVLDAVPGVRVYKHTKGKMRVRIRGFEQDKILILVDGVPINDIYATDLDMSSVPVLNVSKIIINRGVSSALYGTEGAVGTINVITKKPTGMFAELETEYGSPKDVTVNFIHGAPVGKFYYQISGTLMNMGGYSPSAKLDADARRNWFDKTQRYDLYPVDEPFGSGPLRSFDDVTMSSKDQYINDGGMWGNDHYFKYSVSAKAAYIFTPDIELGVSSKFFNFKGETNTYQFNAYNSYRGNRWKPRYPYFDDEPEQVKKYGLRNRSFVWPWVYRFDLSPYFRMRFGDFSIKLNTFYQRQASKQDGYADYEHTLSKSDSSLIKDVFEPFHDYKIIDSLGFRLMPSYRFSKNHRLSMALYFRNDSYLGEEQAISESLAPQVWAIMGGSRYPTEDLAAQMLSIAIEDELHLFNKLKISAGISYDMQNFSKFKQRKGETYEEGYIIDDKSMIMGTRDSFNPVVGMVFDPIKKRLRLRAAGAIKTRFPTVGEYAKIKDDELDQGLKPERSYNANTGFELFFMNKAISFRGDWFMTMIDDRIVKLGSDEPPANVDRVTAFGVESSVTAELADLGVADLYASFMYTLVNARNRDYSDDATVNKGDYIEYSPTHEIGADLRLSFISDTTVGVWMSAFIDQKMYVMDHRPLTTDATYSTDYFTTVQLHNPVFLNARVSQGFLKYYEAAFTVSNLLDDYDCDPYNPGPGRSFYLSLTARWE